MFSVPCLAVEGPPGGPGGRGRYLLLVLSVIRTFCMTDTTCWFFLLGGAFRVSPTLQGLHGAFFLSITGNFSLAYCFLFPLSSILCPPPSHSASFCLGTWPCQAGILGRILCRQLQPCFLPWLPLNLCEMRPLPCGTLKLWAGLQQQPSF